MAIKNVRVKLNQAGVRALLAEAGDDLEKRGDRIASAAGPGHRVTRSKNRDRAVVFVTTDTTDARRAEAERRSLTRSIDAGRG